MSEPTVSRPRSPNFLTRGTGELLPWSWAWERLERERNYWIATVTSQGKPHARPVWGIALDIGVCLSVGAAGFHKGELTRDVSVHVDSAMDVVIVDGTATLIEDVQLRNRACEGFNAKYDMASDGEWVNYLVVPRVAWGWSDGDVNTATKWTFSEITQER